MFGMSVDNSSGWPASYPKSSIVSDIICCNSLFVLSGLVSSNSNLASESSRLTTTVELIIP
jgi:hypothetical protein